MRVPLASCPRFSPLSLIPRFSLEESLGTRLLLKALLLCISVLLLSFTATGTLKGYDQLLNLVLDGTVEHLQGWYNRPYDVMGY